MYIQRICREIEKHQHTHDARDLNIKVREVTQKFKLKTLSIEDNKGKVVWEED